MQYRQQSTHVPMCGRGDETAFSKSHLGNSCLGHLSKHAFEQNLLAIFGAEACGGCFMHQHAVIRDQMLFSIDNLWPRAFGRAWGSSRGTKGKIIATPMGASLLGMASRRAGGFCRHAWHASLGGRPELPCRYWPNHSAAAARILLPGTALRKGA